tara:strand:+ start:77 stop:400 length:324 start_codon:yes stop_codon:yes gene_type:complete
MSQQQSSVSTFLFTLTVFIIGQLELKGTQRVLVDASMHAPVEAAVAEAIKLLELVVDLVYPDYGINHAGHLGLQESHVIAQRRITKFQMMKKEREEEDGERRAPTAC